MISLPLLLAMTTTKVEKPDKITVAAYYFANYHPGDMLNFSPRGDLFHRVAERYLRECRDRGELPVRDTEAAGERLSEMAEEALEWVNSLADPESPPLDVARYNRIHPTFHKAVL